MRRDPVAGLLLVLAGVAIIVAWRTGWLRRLLTVPAVSGQTEQAGILPGVKSVADFMRPVVGGLAQPDASGAARAAAAGVPDNGYSSTYIGGLSAAELFAAREALVGHTKEGQFGRSVPDN